MMGGESGDFLRKVVEEFHALRGVILSEDEGLNISSYFDAGEKKEQQEKYIQTTTLLISAINQTNSNLQKVPLSSPDQDLLAAEGGQPLLRRVPHPPGLQAAPNCHPHHAQEYSY